ncbi:hypothetical protein BJX64DRAFT_137678 [Aspergillus heterothallicus]
MASFGFAIGDFIAVGILASQTIQLLVASRDASSDCQALIETLRPIEASITTARAALDVSIARQDTLNAVKVELDVCSRLIERFIAGSRRYTEQLCNGQSKSF